MKYCLIFVALLFTACAGNQVKAPGSASQTASSEQKKELTRHDRVYYFQHKMMPRWLYESEGAFFDDLINGQLNTLQEHAKRVVDEEFAAALELKVFQEHGAVLIIFQKPQSPPNCYYAVVQRDGEQFTYTTYESTVPMSDEFVGIVGGWSKEGSHQNYGPRAYASADAFIFDVLGEGL